MKVLLIILLYLAGLHNACMATETEANQDVNNAQNSEDIHRRVLQFIETTKNTFGEASEAFSSIKDLETLFTFMSPTGFKTQNNFNKWRAEHEVLLQIAKHPLAQAISKELDSLANCFLKYDAELIRLGKLPQSFKAMFTDAMDIPLPEGEPNERVISHRELMEDTMIYKTQAVAATALNCVLYNNLSMIDSKEMASAHSVRIKFNIKALLSSLEYLLTPARSYGVLFLSATDTHLLGDGLCVVVRSLSRLNEVGFYDDPNLRESYEAVHAFINRADVHIQFCSCPLPESLDAKTSQHHSHLRSQEPKPQREPDNSDEKDRK